MILAKENKLTNDELEQVSGGCDYETEYTGAHVSACPENGNRHSG